MKSVRGTV